ncbi:TPA: glycosyltransferase family 39 protein [Neisseria meningitidis]
MLTYTPPDARPPAKTHEKPWLLLLMAFAWLWPGVFSHDLWNPAEPAVYTAVEALAGSPTPLVAHLFGQTDFGIPPVYLWVAAAFKHLLSPWAADPYDAARFAGVFFAVIGLTSCGFAGFNFLGRHHGRSVVLILIGCIGLIPVAHFLNPAAAAFAAAGLVLHGYSLARRRVIAASFLLGTGWTLMSLAAAYPAAFALMLPLPVLMFFRPWQSRRLMLTAVASLAFALPLMTVYPLLLAKTQPTLFVQWSDYHMFGAFGGVRHVQTAFSLFYYLKNLLWFALPALPLAVWTVCRTRLFSTDWGILGVVWMLAVLVLLAVNPQRFQDNLVWLLPPLALFGAAQLDSLRRGAAAFVNWFGIMAFGLFAVFMWTGFFAMNYGWPAKLAERAAYFSPYYVPDIDPIPMAVAVLFTPLWLWAITRKNIRGRQAVTNWAAGVTLTWALLMTLFLPWLDAAKSHAPVVRSMEASLSPELKRELSDGIECIDIGGGDLHTRIVWTQYGTLPHRVGDVQCRYRIVRLPQNADASQGWQTVWQGARPRNKDSKFALIRKIGENILKTTD